MKIDHSKITGRQLFFSVACFIQSSSLLTAFFSSVTRQDSWFSVIMGIVVILPVIILYSELMKMFPDKTIIGICSEVFGKFVGKILSFIYLLYFLTLAALNTNDLGSFVQSSLLANTPLALIITLFLLICAAAVKGGAQIVCRYATLFTAFALFIMIAGTTLASELIKFENFKPVLTLPIMKYVQGIHIVSMIPLSELVVFLMFTPNIEGSQVKFRRYLILGFLLGAVNLVIVVLRDTSVLGNTAAMFVMPPFEVLRLVNLSPALSRVEVLFALAFLILFFFKISVAFYACVQALAELFGLKSYKSLVYVTGALIVAYSLIVYPSNVEHLKSAISFTPFVWMVPQVIIPLLLLIVAKTRKLGVKPAPKPANNAKEGQPQAQNAEASQQPTQNAEAQQIPSQNADSAKQQEATQ